MRYSSCQDSVLLEATRVSNIAIISIHSMPTRYWYAILVRCTDLHITFRGVSILQVFFWCDFRQVLSSPFSIWCFAIVLRKVIIVSKARLFFGHFLYLGPPKKNKKNHGEKQDCSTSYILI